MRTTSLVLASLAALAAADDKSDVYTLVQKDFHEVVQPEKLMLVEFYAPWCGHCKALAPEYEKAATSLKDDGIKIAKVDCTEQTELCSAYGVQGYPTLKVFRNGEPTDYSGPRKADGIISYMKKQALPAVSEVTADNHKTFSEADKVVIIAYLDADDSVNKEIYNSLAEVHRDDFMFGLSTDASLADVKAPALVLYKKFDEGRNDFSGAFSTEKILDFIEQHSTPLFDEISPENFKVYAEAGIPLAYLFVDPADSKREALIKELEPIALEHKGKINFVWIDAAKFADHAKSLNLEPKWPAFAIQNIAASLKYPLEAAKGVSAKTVGEFAKDFVAGKIAASVKSQPIPKTQDEGVFTLVSDQFDEIVFDDNKDVFVEFYAPWCGHCKKLAPIWDELGEKYAHAKDKLVIAKMDATENDIPSSAGFSVQGFPTIKFKAAGSKTFIDYNGDRSLESLMEFVDANGTHGVKAATTPEGAEFGGDDEEDDEEVGHDEL